MSTINWTKDATASVKRGRVWIELPDGVVVGNIIELDLELLVGTKPEAWPHPTMKNTIVEINGQIGKVYPLQETPWSKGLEDRPTMTEMWENNSEWLEDFLGE